MLETMWINLEQLLSWITLLGCTIGINTPVDHQFATNTHLDVKVTFIGIHVALLGSAARH